MKKLLFIMGGVRVGDTFHLIPHLRKRIAEGYEINWVHGTYAAHCVNLIKNHSDIKINNTWEIPDGYPLDMNSIKRFRDKVELKLKEFGEYDLIESPIEEAAPSETHQYRQTDSYLNLDIERKSDNYITVQPESVVHWKNLYAIRDVQYPLPVKSVGRESEAMIHNSEDCRGMDFYEVAKKIYQCKVFVGMHSGLSCMSFYLNKPTIICHFWEGLFQFSKLHSNCIDLVKPSSEQILESINTLIKKTEGNTNG